MSQHSAMDVDDESNDDLVLQISSIIPHIDASLIRQVIQQFGGNADNAVSFLLSVPSNDAVRAFLSGRGRSVGDDDDDHDDDDDGGDDDQRRNRDVAELVSMGFEHELAENVLEYFGGDMQRATEALIENQIPDEIQAMIEQKKMMAKGPAVFIEDPTDLIAYLESFDASLAKLIESEKIYTQKPPELQSPHKEQIVRAFDEMLARFTHPSYTSKYSGSASDTQMCFSLRAGASVPSYYANASDGNLYTRKILSMAGLRNLVLFGHDIYTALQQQKFSGDPQKYRDGSGLGQMRSVTGNTVDLDHVVLRCSDKQVVDRINADHKKEGLPTFRSGDEFGSSQFARDMACRLAEPYLEGFAKIFKLTTEKQLNDRKINLKTVDPKNIAKATGNTDRGKWPVWQYCNVGVNTFHVNVPDLNDVVGALLRAPVYAAIAYLRVRDIPEGLAEFYDSGIADTCFNAKWKALEEFHVSMRAKLRRDIPIVLAETVKTFQKEMQKLMISDDVTEAEIDFLWSKVRGQSGTDAKGLFREMTREDVGTYLRST